MKNYLVIGGSSGIGKSIADTLRERNDYVISTYNANEDFENETNYFYLDVNDEEIDLSHLPEVLDGLVYCPGAIDLKPFHRMKPEDFLKDFQLQTMGAIKVIQACLPMLKNSESASIVLFSTVAVKLGFPFHAKVAVSKGAIEGLCKSLAAEYAPKIRVNCIAPSLTNTPLASKLLSSDDKINANAERHPLKRVGESKDIAEMAIFLLDTKSSWVTGQVIGVDGGMSSIR